MLKDQRIFISYRRADAGPAAGRLHETLVRLGVPASTIFKDIHDIKLGENFVQKLERELDACAIVLVVMDKEYTSLKNAAGKRRLFEAKDFVRMEVATALRLGKKVVPVTVGGAFMPATTDLPKEIKGLVLQNGYDLRDARWEDDVKDLARKLGLIKYVIPQPLLIAVGIIAMLLTFIAFSMMG